MSNFNILIIVLFSLISVFRGEELDGQCNPNIDVEQDFDADRYKGLWYDVESYEAPFQTGTCPTATYSLNDDGTVSLVNAQVVNQLLETFNGTAEVVSDDGSAKLNVTINVNGNNVPASLWVLKTDYTSYSLAYSCRNLGNNRKEVTSWKLSRSRSLTDEAGKAIDEIISNVEDLDPTKFLLRSHSDEDCFHYPDYFGGDVILEGQCIDGTLVPAIEEFNVEAFAGTWHEISRFSSASQRGECIATKYTVRDTAAYDVLQITVNNESQRNVSSHATVEGDKGVIRVNLDGIPLDTIYVLDTDYDEFALLYGCRNMEDNHKQIFSWKLSKNRSGLSDDAISKINDLVNGNIDLHEQYYRTTGQDNDACFYYPPFDASNPPEYIEMPVPCHEHIRGIPELDLEEYLGRWFEIARYPTPDYKGTCNRGNYAPTNQSTLMFYNEVVDETLVSYLGSAVQAEDGSGYFRVDMHYSEGEEPQLIDYHVLATDYKNYSLVYNCVNTDHGRSKVNLWIRSRSRTISPEALEAVHEVIANTRGLSLTYLQPTSQTDDDCFYIPPSGTINAPLFRGQCETIEGLKDFDIEKYLGWWHEIEAYPNPNLLFDGQCRSSRYFKDGTDYRVEDTSVRNNNGFSVAVPVTSTSDGRLRRNIIGNIFQNVWVLATDYETYSFLYSCVNQDSEHRRVWSAIHMKTRDPISNETRALIAPIIEEHRIFVEDFYLPVNQSAETCFYYPSNSYGDIIINGQCDTEIPVVPNFNVTGFSGDWFHTESYGFAGITTCLGTRVTAGSDSGVINIMNFEVNAVNNLETVNGTARLASDDNSAKIEVTLDVGDTEDDNIKRNVYILATDYNNYALAYSCENVDTYRRQIRAWKLSRERTLSAESNIAINAIIAQRQELHQPYFRPITQNPQCRSPNSAVIMKSSIIVIIFALIHRLL